MQADRLHYIYAGYAAICSKVDRLPNTRKWREGVTDGLTDGQRRDRKKDDIL